MNPTPNTAGTAPAEAAAWANDAARPSIVRLAWNAALPKGCSKLVLMCLAWHACKNGRDECFPHVETIARLCNLHPRTASLHLKTLALAGLITVTPRPNSSSVYRLVRGRLASLSGERTAAVDQVEHPPTVDPVIRALDPVLSAPDPVIPAAGPGDSCTHKGEETGLKEERRESPHAPAALPLHDQPTLPAPDDDSFKTLNANRTAQGKERLQAADVRCLAVQALAAGRSLAEAARHAGDSGWRWFNADWRGARVEQSPSTPSGPVEVSAAAQAALAIRRAYEGTGATASAATAAAHLARARAACRASTTVTVRPSASTSLVVATGTGWARAAVARFVAGQSVAHATLTSAAAALGLSLSDLKAQRAASPQQQDQGGAA